MAAYMLYRLYHTSSQLAESNRRTLAFEVTNKSSILQEFFAERLYDLERFVANPLFQTYFQRKTLAPANEQAMKIISGQIEQELLVSRLRIERQGKPVYSRIAFYDIEKKEIIAKTDFSPKGRWINEELFGRITGTVSQNLSLVSICLRASCRVLMIGYVEYEGARKAAILLELTPGVIRDQIQLLSLQKPDNFTGLTDASGRLILGPDNLIGQKIQDLFGLTPENLGKIRAMDPDGKLQKITGEDLVVAGAQIPGIKFYLAQVDNRSKYIGGHSPLLWTLVFISLMIALALVLTHIFKSYAERQVMYRRLQEAHDNLELRVRERTAELVALNDKLKLEVQERMRAEQALREAGEELRSVNRDLQDFAYVVSHDLKAPLRSARQVLDWIREDYEDRFDEAGREYLELLTERVKLMHGLIEGILKYSRVGRSNEGDEMVDLQEMMNDIIAMMAAPPNIEIEIENHLPAILGEPTGLHEVFQNLLDNAIKYMDKSQGIIKIGSTVKNGDWLFKVQDNGPGIDRSEFDNIFKIFRTLSETEDIQSTGIGLALVKKIIERKGGRVWVESEPGKGSTFFFTLPKRVKASEKVVDVAEPEETLQISTT
jgi:signal transduction histidine kinase